MGFGPESVKVVDKQQQQQKKNKLEKSKKKKDKEREIGCWFRLRVITGCLPSRSKVDNSLSGVHGTNYGNLGFLR